MDALVAQAQVWKHARQWSNLAHKIDPSRIFGEAFDKLPDSVKQSVRFATNKAMGRSGERYLENLLGRMDPNVGEQIDVLFPAGLGAGIKGRRTYDFVARSATAILVEDIAG